MSGSASDDTRILAERKMDPVSFRGNVSTADAHSVLLADPAAVLVDVRTAAEFATIGFPDLSGLGKTLVMAEWPGFPDADRSRAFVDRLAELDVDPASPVYFICRSGVRSRFAAKAAADLGFAQTFNVAHGFEGDPDGDGLRGRLNGWQSDDLPWKHADSR